MGTEWRARRWRRLLNWIDNLPRHSAFHEALSNDEQFAGMLMKLPEKKTGPVRLMREFTPEVEVQSVIADRLAELIQAVGATKGAKPKQIRLQPRPVTAMQRINARRRKSKHESIVARMLPHRGKKALPPAKAPVQPPAKALVTAPVTEDNR